jgi:Cu2+-exporting ATPase
MSTAAAPAHETVVLHVGGLQYATEKAVVERALGNRPGVLAVDANPVAQTATVTYDPERTSVEALADWVEECGYHCAGQPVPGHVCDPMAEHGAAPAAHDHAAMERAEHAHGHGHGGHRCERVRHRAVSARSGRRASALPADSGRSLRLCDARAGGRAAETSDPRFRHQ